MKRLIPTFVALALFALPSAAFADAPFQFAAPGLRAPDDPHVNGVRLSALYGKNQRIRGLDFGMFALSETDNFTGFSSIFGIHKLNGNMDGFASSFVNMHSGTDVGVNAAFINLTHRLKHGANIGFVNIAEDFTETDLGGLNMSDASTVQVGFINMTKRIDAVQIGFLNVADNGFLPVFPFFNFPKP